MVVEWSRSCYSSNWLLCRDDPTIKTRGRYYFAPRDTPHFPSLHRLGSRTWLDSNWRTAQTLGEDLTAVHNWDAGELPADLPRAIPVGTPECIAEGEYASEMISADSLHGGFSPHCMGPDEQMHLWKFASWYADICTQKLYARLIKFLYVSDIAGIKSMITAWLGETVAVRFHAGTAILPRVITMIAPGWSAAIADGTDNFEQLALQAFESISGPTNLGAFSSLPLWRNASQWILNFLVSDGYVAGTPLMLAGHSYGAAATHNLAARLRAASPTLHIRYLTFGCPKIGDLRMVNLLARCEGYDLANDGDFVTVLPPSLPELTPVNFIIGLPALLRWTQWYRPPHQALIRVDGSVLLRVETLTDTAVLLFMAEEIIIGNPIGAIGAHSISSYYNRLSIRCPGDGATCDEATIVTESFIKTYSIGTEFPRWFVRIPTLGLFLLIRLVIGATSTVTAVCYYGPSCDDLTGFAVLTRNNPNTNFYTQVPGINLYVKVMPAAAATESFTLQITLSGTP